MVIDLDIHIDLHYRSTSVCRVRFVTIELEKKRGRYRLIVLGGRTNVRSKIELGRFRPRERRGVALFRGGQ